MDKTAKTTAAHGHHAQSFSELLNHAQHQLTLAVNDPSGHWQVLLVAAAAVYGAFWLLGQLGTLSLKLSSPGVRSTSGGGSGAGVEVLAQGTGKIAFFILCLAIPTVMFTPMFDNGRAAVMTILGAGS
jgi:hypothetical protein